MTTTSDDFRSQIDQLAEVARQELIERQEGLRQRPPAKRISAILWLGGILIALEAALLGVQILYQERIAPAADSRPHPLLFADDCKGETYRTFQALVAYRREQGAWPASLPELVEHRYLPKLPVAPGSGAPLRYARRGEGFTLDCPTTPAK